MSAVEMFYIKNAKDIVAILVETPLF